MHNSAILQTVLGKYQKTYSSAIEITMKLVSYDKPNI